MLRGSVLLSLLSCIGWWLGASVLQSESALGRAQQAQLEPLLPAPFHAAANASNEDVFFEGWYYKLVGPYTDDIILVIPGLLRNRVNRSASEAFISVSHGTQVNYFRFPIEKFQATQGEDGTFEVRIADSVFTEKSITLSIMPNPDTDNATDIVVGEIQFEDQTPWMPRFLHPTSMGILAWFPGLDCYHAVLSMHHRLHGYISVGERLTDLEQGSGYSEKNWGRDFPNAGWVWAQSDHFALIKPPKRGNEVEGEVWAETEENVEETAEEGPGAGESSGAISALYADHVNNHAQPVSLMLSMTKVRMVHWWQRWLSVAMGHTPDEDGQVAGFVAAFLYDKQTHVFASYQMDELVAAEIEVSEKDEGKEILHLSFVDRHRAHRLDVQLHKPFQINAAKKRKKDTACLKKAISQKNREKERLAMKAKGGKLNAIEEAFLMDDINNPKDDDSKDDDAKKTPQQVAAEKAALEAGIAAAKALDPQAQLDELYSKPVPTPAPTIAHLYGPRQGRMQQYVKEMLVGGRIELQYSRLLSTAAYAAVPMKRRRTEEWKQTIVGLDVMYASTIYRAIGKPAAMEMEGDVEALLHLFEERNAAWQSGWLHGWIMQGQGYTNNAALLAATIVITLLLANVLTKITQPKRKNNNKKEVEEVDTTTRRNGKATASSS